MINLNLDYFFVYFYNEYVTISYELLAIYE